MTGATDYLLQTRGLAKSFGGFMAVGGVDLDIRRGAIHALIGPNGAGKTTTFNLLTRTIPQSAGTIWFDGIDISREGSAAVARRGMVRSFQISAVFPHMTVRENLEVALQSRFGGSERLWRRKADGVAMARRVDELLDDVGLVGMEDRLASELAYGRKRALELATTLALEPSLLLLDEPTSGLGAEDIERVSQLIRRVSAGRTIVMVEHNLGVVKGLCDRVTVLTRGEVLTEGTYAEIAADPRVIEAYLGDDHG